MLRTDLDGLINNIKDSPVVKLGALIIGLIVLYCVVSNYLSSKARNNFANIIVLNGGMTESGYRDIPKIDEAIIRNMIDLPNRDPKMLTSSMVIPEPKVDQEQQKQSRMEVLNMFYNSFDDDLINVNKRPQGLYLVP
jgi:hypothetical protein